MLIPHQENPTIIDIAAQFVNFQWHMCQLSTRFIEIKEETTNEITIQLMMDNIEVYQSNFILKLFPDRCCRNY